MRQMDDAFGHWLAGFIDGEGCFMVRCFASSATRPTRYSCNFSLNQRADEDGLLEKIIEHVGFGTLQKEDNITCWSRPSGGRPLRAWRVDSIQACIKLVDFLDRYPLRSRKRHDYAIWRDAVEWRACHPGTPDWTPLIQARQALKEARAWHMSS